MTADRDQHDEALPAKSCGGYEILAELGRGGLGVVYKARDPRLNQIVALKMIRAGRLASAAEVRRFHREAEAAAHLDHPNIVTIHEVGEDSGRHYFVMKLIEGGSLAQHRDRLRRTRVAAVRLLATAARAVHFAHERGILHGDLKPANILLDAAARPHLTGFGLASGSTTSGVDLGAPEYLAPEQARSSPSEPTPQVDVYALGAILYEVLTGRPPFEGDTATDILAQVVQDEPVRPRLLDAEVDRGLETICLKCLEKDPQRRYPSAAALADDLERWLSGQRITGRGAGPLTRLGRWGLRHPERAALAALGVLVVLAVGGLVAWQVDRAGRQQPHPERPTTAAQALDLAVSLCQAGDVDQGLLWLAWAMEKAPADAGDLRQNIRQQLVDWYRVRNGRAVLPDQALDALLLSPDGKTILTRTSQALAAQVYDAATGEPVGEPLRHPHALWEVGFGADDKPLPVCLLAASRLWERNVLAPPSASPWHQAAVQDTLLSPDGTLLLTWGADRTVRLWDAATGLPACPPLVHAGEINAADFSPDGRRVLTLASRPDQEGHGGEPVLRLWEVPGGRLLHEARLPLDLAAFSPNGQFLVFPAGDKALSLLSAETGNLIGEPLVLLESVSAATFNLDSTVLAGAAAGEVRLWEVATRKPRGSPLRAEGEISWVQFSPDGNVLIALGSNKDTAKVWLWDWQTGRALNPPLPQHPHAPASVIAWTPDSKGVVTCPEEHTLALWEVSTGKRLWQLHLPAAEGAPEYAAFSPDGSTLLTATSEAVRLWEAATGKALGQKIRRQWWGAPGEVVFSPDSKTVLARRREIVDQLWAASTGQAVGTPLAEDAQGGPTVLPLFSPDGTSVLVSTGTEAQFRASATGNLIGRPLPHPGITCMVFRPDGKWVLTAGGDLRLRLWEAPAGTPVGQPIPVVSAVSAAAFSPDGSLVVTGHDNGEVRFWKPATGEALGPPLSCGAPVEGVTFSPDGTLCLLTAFATNSVVKLLDVTRKSELASFPGKADCFDLLFAPGGRSAVTVATKGKAQLWDLATRQPIGAPVAYHEHGKGGAHLPAVYRLPLVFSPDGALLLTGESEVPAGGEQQAQGKAVLRDAATGNQAGEPLPHPAPVDAVAFSPEGQLFATGSEDGKARLWETTGGKALGVPLPHGDWVVRVAFSPDGKTLLTAAGRSDPVGWRLWDVAPAVPSDPRQVVLWAQVVTRQELVEGELRPLAEPAWKQRRQQLQQLGWTGS
jgi:eukaryotic-like serine/threonine-protein kinase